MTLQPYGGRTFAGNVFSGAYNSNSVRIVQNANSPSLSTDAYMGGSYSGEVAMEFTQLNATITTGTSGPETYSNFLRYETHAGVARFGNRDTGAPIYSIHCDGKVTTTTCLFDR